LIVFTPKSMLQQGRGRNQNSPKEVPLGAQEPTYQDSIGDRNKITESCCAAASCITTWPPAR
jgi:hypothetical protein